MTFLVLLTILFAHLDRLTVDEEKLLVKQYTKTIVIAFGKWLGELLGPGNDVTAWVVKWSAATLFRRYYVHHTMADISPKEIMVGCMLLASKIEECRVVTAEALHIWRERKYTIPQIVEAECEVASGVTFDLHIFSPSVALSGIFEMLTSKCNEIASVKTPSDLPAGHLELAQATLKHMEDKKLRGEVLKNVETLLNSDAMYVLPPAEIALAAASRGPLKDGLQTLLDLKCDDRADSYFSEAPVSPEDFKRVDAKLERVRNPLFNRDSEEYKAQQKQKEDQYVRKQEVKHELIAKEQSETMVALGVGPNTAQPAATQ